MTLYPFRCLIKLFRIFLFTGITNTVNEFKDKMSSDPSSSLLSDKEKHVTIFCISLIV